MPISIDTLQSASRRYLSANLAKSLQQAQSARLRTAFLCHSHRDESLVRGFQVLMRESGCNVYLDWQDASMPDTPNRETAQRIQSKIRELDWFIFLATPNSTSSRWCPWEIGFADSVKQQASIFIVATNDQSGNWYGNEYLQLYRRINFTTSGELAAFAPGQTDGVFMKSL